MQSNRILTALQKGGWGGLIGLAAFGLAWLLVFPPYPYSLIAFIVFIFLFLDLAWFHTSTKPERILMVILLLLPFQFLSILPGDVALYVTDLLATYYVLCALIQILYQRINIPYGKLGIPALFLGFFFFWMTLASLKSPDSNWPVFLRLGTYAVLCVLVAVSTVSRLTLIRYFQCLLISVTVWMSATLLLDFASGRMMAFIQNPYEHMRPGFILGFPMLGIGSMLGIPIAYALWVRESRRLTKGLYLAAFLFSVFCCILSFARSSWLAVTAVALLFFSQTIKRGIVICLILFVMVGISLPLIIPRTTDMFSSWSWKNRIEGFHRGAGIVQESPVFGIGFGNFAKQNYVIQTKRRTLQLRGSHNSYFDIVCDGGLPALLFYLLFQAWMIAGAWRAASREREPRAKITYFALVVLVIEISIYSLAHKVHLHLFYWMIMAFCLAYLKISKDEEAVPAVIKSTGQ